jgi:hypothetical protein
MPKGTKRVKHYFFLKPERISGAICPVILLEQFQKADRLNIKPIMTFHVEFLVKKVPLQSNFSQCF